MQREIPLLNQAHKPELAPMELVKLCRNKMDSILLCIQLSRLSHEAICEYLEIDKGNFSRMLQGHVNLPQNKENLLMELCGNYAPLQWVAWMNNFDF